MPKVVPEYREQAKNRILEHSFEVFSEKGYHKTTMNDIAKKVGVNKATLYLYFENKEELFMKMIEATQQMMYTEMTLFFTGINFTNDYIKFFDFYVKMNAGYEQFVAEIHAIATRDKEMKKALRQSTKKTDELIIHFLKEQQKNGLIGKDVDVQFFTMSAISLLEGLIIKMFYGMSKSEAKNIWKNSVAQWLEH